MNIIRGPLDIPGYAEAIEKEQLFRNAAFLPVNESVGGFEAKPLTLFHFMLLRLADSPFLPPFRTPTPVQLAQFLWIVSPQWSMDKRSRKRFLKHCRSFMPPVAPWTRLGHSKWIKRAQAALAIASELTKSGREYVSESLMDRPPMTGGASSQPDYYSDAAFFVGILGREYGWTLENVLHTPLKVIFQQLNEIKSFHTPSEKLILGNPISGRVVNDYLTKANAELLKGGRN